MNDASDVIAAADALVALARRMYSEQSKQQRNVIAWAQLPATTRREWLEEADREVRRRFREREESTK